MKKFIPALILFLCVVSLARSFMPPTPRDDFDLERFERLPALHNGRIKPLDTIARTSLLLMRSKQTLKTETGRLSAVEWFADVVARPEKADTYRSFVVDDPDVLGLAGLKQDRRYFSFKELEPSLEKIAKQARPALEKDANARSRFERAVANLHNRLTLYQRLNNGFQVVGTKDFPQEIQTYFIHSEKGLTAMAAHQEGKEFDEVALRALAPFVRRYEFLKNASPFHPLPPLEGNDPNDWHNTGAGLLNTLREGDFHPGLKAYAQMMQAIQHQDPPSFNKALDEYIPWLEQNHGDVLREAAYEVTFNRVEPFYRGIHLYVIVFLLSLLGWLFWRKVWNKAAYQVVWLAFAVHTFGLISRIWLQGRPPVTNLYSSAVFVGWGAVLLGLILEKIHRQGIGTWVSAVVGGLTLIVAHNLATSAGDTMEMMRAVLDSNFWLGTHVVVITIGYSSTFLAGVLGHVYIFRRWLKIDGEAERSITSMIYGIICFSLLFSFVGTILGGIWADQSWGRFWGWDPKENGALLIVIWNAMILHARLAGLAKAQGLAIMAVFGNVITCLSWFGVNMLGIGLHSYGFMDQAFFWMAAFIATQLAVMLYGYFFPFKFKK